MSVVAQPTSAVQPSVPAGMVGHYVADPFTPGTQTFAIAAASDPNWNPYGSQTGSQRVASISAVSMAPAASIAYTSVPVPQPTSFVAPQSFAYTSVPAATMVTPRAFQSTPATKTTKT